MIQWWYGHNAVGFFLTAGFLGMMYYFIPKQADRPVYSYRLSIVHFWTLIFLYIWAGPHHLHYTALPDWAQVLGMVFSVMLWMPSWGGMINGLMTLSGAWDKLRTDAGAALLGHRRRLLRHVDLRRAGDVDPRGERAVALHRLDHRPRAFAARWAGSASSPSARCTTCSPCCGRRRAMWSEKLIAWHFWLATLGIVFYITAMWVSGIMQGLMWRAYDELGFLQYSFVETVEAMHPYYVIRALGGVLYLSGGLIMVFNLWKTVTSQRRRLEPEPVPVCQPSPSRRNKEDTPMFRWLRDHGVIERNLVLMGVLTLITVSIGGLVQIVPLFAVETTIERVSGVRPYTPLEQMGRDIYVREGCYLCHSQMIRPFRDELERYGHYSLAAESMYDHPFQWGSQAHGAGPRARRRAVFG